MQGLQRILVGVDFNEKKSELPLPTQEAIKKGLWLAEARGAQLILLTVFPEEFKPAEDQAQANDHQNLSILVNNQINELLEATPHDGVEVISKFAYGRGWYELIREVLREDVDLLIVGTREKNIANRMIYGSTGMKLLRKCPCSVLITRPEVEPLEVSTVVAADDLSPVSDKVLHAAVSTAQLIDARLLVVHAADYPLEGGMIRTECSQEDIDNYREKVRGEAEKEIFDRLSMTDYRTIHQGTQILVQGGPADSVVEQVITENNADLLVMGTIGRGGIPGFLIGNTAERLLPALNCSVLAIKPDDFVSPVKVD